MTTQDPSDAAAGSHESPCTGVCVIDPTTGWCLGCFRTLDEIAAWGQSSTSDRSQTLGRLEQRKTQAGG
jgi:uncharacterized protein